MYINSMDYVVNVNILVPRSITSGRLPMTIRHGGYKLFVSCSILFDQLKIDAIPVEYMVPSNWRLNMVLLGQHGCSTSI